MNIQIKNVVDIIPYDKNTKKHDKTQINNVAESIKQYGFVQPVVVDENNVIVIGHCRVLAAKKLGIKEVPCVYVDDLTPEQVNALRIVDNKSNESDWDMEFLADELSEIDLSMFDFDFDLNNEEQKTKERENVDLKESISVVIDCSTEQEAEEIFNTLSDEGYICRIFDIIKENKPDETFRVSKIQADFDVKLEHSNEHFVGDLELPDKWQIGVIVGASGTGKSTIAKELFGDALHDDFQYKSKSVIDDMPKNKSIANITKMFYSVGFGSVPSWLKPYNVLSNGEKMRVDLARLLLEKDFVCFDEFTSVVDRQVAQTACIAINKAIKKTNKKFVAVSCHYDILEWLQPDWVFDTNKMQGFFGIAHGREKI